MNVKRLVAGESITHDTAVQTLRRRGRSVADMLAFRNVDGGLGGWDDYVRGTFSKKIVGIVWPEKAALTNRNGTRPSGLKTRTDRWSCRKAVRAPTANVGFDPSTALVD